MNEKIKYLTPKQIASDGSYPFSIGQIRHYLIHRHRNGLGVAVRKIGKRIFINKELFDQWIESKSTP